MSRPFPRVSGRKRSARVRGVSFGRAAGQALLALALGVAPAPAGRVRAAQGWRLRPAEHATLNMPIRVLSPAMESTPAGTWIGWAYLGHAGDLPLRFDLHVAGRHLLARFDSPAQKTFGRTIEDVTWRAPQMRLAWSSSSGSAVVLEGEVKGNVIDGTMEWGTASGTFELTRSPLSIVDVDPDEYADAVGLYERAPGDVVELSARPWGELLYHERRTGRVRTLLPLGADRFFIGSAMYVPRPVEAYLRIERDSVGRVRALVEQEPGGPERVARRAVIRSEAIGFQNGRTHLAGTLQIPSHNGRLPGIVVIGGSAWRKRDDVAYRARTLAAIGFVVLSFDRRGFGESAGNQVVPFDTTARDAVAALEVLRRQPEVDSTEIGLFGASRGGWIAPLAAVLSREARFLVLLVPPAVSPARQETTSRLTRMRASGASAADLALADSLLTATWRWVRSGGDWKQYAALRARAVARAAPDYLLEADTQDSTAWLWARLNMFFQPCPVLERVHIPVLAIFAERDLHVAARTNRARLLECLARGGNHSATTYTVPGAGHDLSVPDDSPIHRWKGGGDEGFSVIADWALRKFPTLR